MSEAELARDRIALWSASLAWDTTNSFRRGEPFTGVVMVFQGNVAVDQEIASLPWPYTNDLAMEAMVSAAERLTERWLTEEGIDVDALRSELTGGVTHALYASAAAEAETTWKRFQGEAGRA